jgi:hypothetical protein
MVVSGRSKYLLCVEHINYIDRAQNLHTLLTFAKNVVVLIQKSNRASLNLSIFVSDELLKLSSWLSLVGELQFINLFGAGRDINRGVFDFAFLNQSILNKDWLQGNYIRFRLHF